MKTLAALREAALFAALIAPLFLLSCATSSDLSGSLVGRVLSSASFQPISGAYVECDGNVSLSDNLGYYSIGGISPGDRVVTASASGFEDYTAVVDVGEDTEHDVYMDPDLGEARLYGYVTHSVLGPIEGATVTLGGTPVSTDSLGYYEYPSVQQITYNMTVTKDSFRFFSAMVQVTDEDFRYDVNLKKLKTVVLPCVADAWCDASAPDANYGDDTELRLLFNNLRHYNLYLRFPLELEDTAEAVDAALRLYNVWEEGEAAGRTILTARVITAWGESSITWNYMVEGTTGGQMAASVYEPRWYEIDVTSTFRDWLTGGSPNYGLQVDTTQEAAASRFYFASREHENEAYRPTVTLEYAW